MGPCVTQGGVSWVWRTRCRGAGRDGGSAAPGLAFPGCSGVVYSAEKEVLLCRGKSYRGPGELVGDTGGLLLSWALLCQSKTKGISLRGAAGREERVSLLVDLCHTALRVTSC